MKLHEIRYFLAVCEALNFHRAAAACHVSQPALTRAVQNLEDEVGGALLQRDHHHTQLTDLGRLLRPRFVEIWHELAAVQRLAREFARLERAEITLGVLGTIGALPLAGFLEAVRQRHPGILVEIGAATPGRLCAQLLEGAVELALVAQPGPYDARLRTRALFTERFGVVFPAGHRFEACSRLGLGDLAGEPFLQRVGCEYAERIGELCRNAGVTLHPVHRVPRDDWAQAMVVAGAGVCCMPEFSVTRPDLRLRPLDEAEMARTVSAVWVAGRTLSPAAAALRDAACSHGWPGAARLN